MLFHLLHVISFFLLVLISSSSSRVYADQSPALQSPDFCFNRSSASSSNCGKSVEYPFNHAYDSTSNSCGYPGLSNEKLCDSRGRAVVNISDHDYSVIDIQYKYQYMLIVETEGVDGQECPQPKRNLSLPSSPSWVKYSLDAYYGDNITIFYNCSRVPVDAKKHLLCSDDYYNTTNTPPSYAFYYDEIPKESFDWYGNCPVHVVVQVDNYYRGKTNYTGAIQSGFFMRWNATGWCADCERSGGQCWSNSTATATATATGCACRDDRSYNRSCPPPPPPPPLPPRPRHQGISTGLKIGFGVLAGIGGLLLVAFLVFYRGVNHYSLSMLHWRYKNKSPINVELFLEKYGCLSLQRYNYSDIRKMTNSFKDILGQGGYGRVFKGELRDGRLVAVKVLNESKGDGEDFINEVAIIGRTNHVNVVSLVGFCIEGTERALVYEFMPNGSLEQFIYNQKESSTALPLGWDKLYQIAIGIARGLEYLHCRCNTRILHFDIKPHNILLDENFCPKISDFGLAKLYPTRESNVSTFGARGTPGYIAPELCYRSFGNVSHKSDVYSYGMLMLEMIGGRKNFDEAVENSSKIFFPEWVYDHLVQHIEAEGMEEIQAKEVFEDEKAKRMIIIALWCIQAHPVDRPSISRVVEMLEGNTQQLEMPPSPAVDPRSSSFTASLYGSGSTLQKSGS